MDRTVTVWGKPHPVKVSQSSRTSFTAAAMFQGAPPIRGRRVGVILSGGNVDLTQVGAWLETVAC